MQQKTTNNVFVNHQSGASRNNNGSSERTWVMQLLENLYQPLKYSIPPYCDNLSTIRLVENPVFHATTKYVEVHYHFIREKVLRKEIELKHVRTENQVADLFTKDLSGNKFESFCHQLRVLNKVEAGVERKY